jgi:prevent-host-death family protein
MKHVGIFEAKTHLSNLVDEVAQGEEIVITRHGKPVAKLVGCAPQQEPQLSAPGPELVAQRRKALAELREIAARLKINPTHEEIKGWINEGRK